MDEERADLYNQSMDLLERYARCIIRDSKDDASMPLNTLVDQMKYYCEAQEKFNTETKAFKEILQSDQDKNEVLSRYQKIQTMSQNVDLNYNTRYMMFLKLINNNKEDDEDICTLSENINTIDPISKQRIVDPVKNKKCGHSYERTTIMQLLSQRPMTRCPMVGCASKTVLVADLVPDVELKRYLESAESQERGTELEVSSYSLNDTVPM